MGKLFGASIALILLILAQARAQDLRSLDPHAVLGVARGASEAEVTKAWRKAALLVHPDRNPGKDMHLPMVKVNLAMEHLLKGGEWPYAQAAPKARPPQTPGARDLERIRRKAHQGSVEHLIERLRSEPFDLEVAVIVDEILRRGDAKAVDTLFGLADLHLQTFSPLPRVLLGKMKGNNHPQVLRFLKDAARRNYGSFVDHVQGTGMEVAQAVLERIDQPGMLEAAGNMAKTHRRSLPALAEGIDRRLSARACPSQVILEAARKLGSIR